MAWCAPHHKVLKIATCITRRLSEIFQTIVPSFKKLIACGLRQYGAEGAAAMAPVHDLLHEWIKCGKQASGIQTLEIDAAVVRSTRRAGVLISWPASVQAPVLLPARSSGMGAGGIGMAYAGRAYRQGGNNAGVNDDQE